MPYGERMLFLIGAGVMLIGAGWFLLIRWPSIEEVASPPASVSVEGAATPVEDTAPVAEELVAEPEVAPSTEEPAPVEGSSDTIQNEVLSVPENAVPAEAPLPEPVELEQEVTVPEVEAPAVEEERHSEAVVEYPLPAESIRPAESERDAPIQMVITRDRPVSKADEAAEVPQADPAVSE